MELLISIICLCWLFKLDKIILVCGTCDQTRPRLAFISPSLITTLLQIYNIINHVIILVSCDHPCIMRPNSSQTGFLLSITNYYIITNLQYNKPYDYPCIMWPNSSQTGFLLSIINNYIITNLQYNKPCDHPCIMWSNSSQTGFLLFIINNYIITNLQYNKPCDYPCIMWSSLYHVTKFIPSLILNLQYNKTCDHLCIMWLSLHHVIILVSCDHPNWLKPKTKTIGICCFSAIKVLSIKK